MKKIFSLIAIIAILFIWRAYSKVNSLQQQNQVLQANHTALLTEYNYAISEATHYKVADSLNAVKISALQLSLAEYKKYRAEDLKIIEQLKLKKSDIQKIITPQVESSLAITIPTADSIKANTLDTLKCFKYYSTWADIEGCLKDTIADIQIKNREALEIVETVVYKRFLGFLWKTNKVKSRDLHVVSKNPATLITNVSYINIED